MKGMEIYFDFRRQIPTEIGVEIRMHLQGNFVIICLHNWSQRKLNMTISFFNSTIDNINSSSNQDLNLVVIYICPVSLFAVTLW